MKLPASLALLLACAACNEAPQRAGQQPEAAAEASGNAAVSNVSGVIDESALAPAAGPGGAASTASAALEQEMIPGVLQGRWGINPADCTTRLGDDKGLLTVTGKDLKFYESIGTLKRISERSPTRIDAEFAFSGEGERWDSRMVLESQQNGTVLVRREFGEGAPAGPLRYEKCA